MEKFVLLQERSGHVTHVDDSSHLCPPPYVFKHKDLIASLDSAKRVALPKLINTINFLHFSESIVWVYLLHTEYEEGILLRASLKPCTGSELTCNWAENVITKLNLHDFHFQYIILSDGQSIIFIPGRLLRVDLTGLTISLPEVSYNISRRKHRRYDCCDISMEIFQNGIYLKGILVDFTAIAFRVRIFPNSTSSFIGFNAEETATVNLKKRDYIFFSSNCQLIRQSNDIFGREMVFAPTDSKISRFRKAKIRSPRYQLSPPPSIIFNHPFFGARLQREILDISNSGFSVIERDEDSVLMPGMIIPRLKIVFSGSISVECKVQVIYRKTLDDTERIRCGIAILDMDLEDFSTLNQILSQSRDHFSNVSSSVDLNALWEFFFDSNFIYPDKYKFIHNNKQEYKETYKKLYQSKPEIAKHFTYESEGKIYGHIAMVRAYEYSWMIHHYASRAMDRRLVGFVILKEILKYINGAYRLASANMCYLMTYFRASNKIIDRVFGGYSRELNLSKGCSVDAFAYYVHHKSDENAFLPPEWELRRSTQVDLWHVEKFYTHSSNGLYIQSLGLGNGESKSGSLATKYKNHGFKRNLSLFSLTFRKEPAALIAIDQSDIGFNLSNLLNGFKIIILDTEAVKWDILKMVMQNLSRFFDVSDIPALIYPYDYTLTHNCPIEKQYNLWILDVAGYGNDFLSYMEKHFRIRLD